ncbi:MAG: helix-turn-helix domain-containing protein [Pseudomonadota bacterium]
MTNWFQLGSVSFDAICIVMGLLIAGRVMVTSPRHINSWLVLLIALGVASNVLSSRQDYGPLIDAAFQIDVGAWHPLMNVLRNASAAWFMLMCHGIFRDGERLPRVLFAVIAVQLFLEEPIEWIIGTDWGPANWVTLVHEVVPSLFQLSYVGISFYWTIGGMHADLDQNRRRIRVFVLVIFTSQVLLSLGVERVAMGFGWIPWAWQYPIHVVFIGMSALFTTVLVFIMMSPQPLAVLVPVPGRRPGQAATATSPPDAVDDAAEFDMQRIQTALAEERVYRQNGLTVAGLAEHVGLPEYRLRNLVHEHLQFRNFNALLHHYRIADVVQALEDPEQRQTPILTLALSAGYLSINPFNRAFREIYGLPPSEYRRQALQKRVDSSKNRPISEIDQPLK